jgi:glycosidase
MSSLPTKKSSNLRQAIFRWLFVVLALFLTACDTGAIATPTLSPPTPAPTTAPTATVPATTPTLAAFPVVTPEPVNAPAWARDSVLYQIFVRAFTPEGTLAAAETRLPDLKDMGISLIYLMPIHPIGKVNRKGSLGSPYSIADYTAIDPALGTEADLKAFVDKAHSLNMHVMMDLVANHTAWDNVLTVQHPDWYRRTADGKFQPPNPDWTDVIQLDHTNPNLLNYMVDMTTHYMQADGIDGFRCDYSTGVPMKFWAAWRAALKKVNPDVFLLSENDDEPLADIFDATYDQNTYKTMRDAYLQKNPGLLINQPLIDRQGHGDKRLRTRFLENHDQRRASYIFQTAPPEALEAASAYLLTTDDIPFIQNGQEVGITQTLSLFEPDKIKWDIGRPALRDTFKKVLTIRNANPALRHGDIADAKSSEKSVVAFLRRSSDQQALVLISLGKEPVHVTIDPEVAKRQGHDLVDGLSVDLAGGIDMPSYSWRIIELK